MKKYILPFMSIAMLMAIASCSSSDDAVIDNSAEGKLVKMTFTATQESNVGTRTALDNKNVIWKDDDKISVFDQYDDTKYNHEFTLSSGDRSTSGSFTGEVNYQNTTFYAVYPYTAGAMLKSDPYGETIDYVSGITLPSTQTAYEDSFDPNAALMIAKSSDKNTFNFLNVVSLVKVTTEFACKRIVLNANEDIAGTGNLYWDNTDPSISFTSNTSKSIVLKPQNGQDEIAAGTYYIAVKPNTYTSGWSISFTSTDYNVYTRNAANGVIFNRGYIRSIGTFTTDGTWTHTSRGSKVQANQEVDLGLTITKDGTKYRVIFANANLRATLTATLTDTGLAEKETDYGDYFAWGATVPWYNSYTTGTDGNGNPTVASNGWKEDHESGYAYGTAPTLGNKYTSIKDFEMSDDPANHILGGDWQIPTKEIWGALYGANKNTVNWGPGGNKDLESIISGIRGMKITKEGNSNTYLFLPAAGYVQSSSFYGVGSNGRYWSGTAKSDIYAYYLYFSSGSAYEYNTINRYDGYPVRPVRLVAVD